MNEPGRKAGFGGILMRFRHSMTCILGALLVASPLMASETVTYRYDAKGRLVKVTHSGTVNNGRVETVCHDRADNRTKVKSHGTGDVPTCLSTSATT